MASTPGPLTEWPWQRLGNYKYMVLAPWVLHGLHMVATKEWKDVHISYIIIFPSLLLRMIHNQLWISLSRFQNARSRRRIVDRSIDFAQVDRERNWSSDHSSATHGPCGVPLLLVPQSLAPPFPLLSLPLHHHASIVTEPITSVIHPFAEHVVYYLLFSIPMLTTIFTGTASILSLLLYVAFIDFMNNMGHCNFELVPKWFFRAFPPLKYLMYTPSFHSLHHTQFRTNYSLFMPFYDYVYNTMDKSSDELYENSLKGKDETPDLVHLTHPTTLQSIFHLRLGFASLASEPYDSKWYMLIMWPIALLSMAVTWIYGSSFVVERINLKKLKMQTWAIPRYNFHYGLAWEKEVINELIEKAIIEADERGVKAKELNGSGELYLQKYPKLRLRIVDGSSLAAAVVLKSIPPGTNQVLLCGKLSKVACATAIALCQKGVQVVMTEKQEFHMLKPQIPESAATYLTYSSSDTPTVWIVGGVTDEEQRRASKGTLFVPLSQFPLKKIRKDCTYYATPAMKIPETLRNVHSCENWLPRRVMSAWRVAGIVHALEGWDTHECGDTVTDIEKIWSAAIRHGFRLMTQA
uniref:aldehyde oxygenase (deformylating) n=1 Tax=Ananas comosus var. bracteatus TaxID=296719 RepID=A0A6V7QKQ8_ANACO|nr:unnamed protein product [Ananas comosus var. bracteatus]